MSISLFSVNSDCPCRDAAGKHNLIATVCQSPTGDFSLARKVTKRASKGLPLRYPLFKKRAFLLFSALACRMGAAFAPLPLNKSSTKVCSFPSVCLERRKLANSCSTRHSKGKAETDFTAAGAGERGNRFAHSLPACRKKNYALIVRPRKNGVLKGCPLGELWVLSFSGKYPVGDRHSVATRLCLAAASRHGQSNSTKKEADQQTAGYRSI